MKNQWKEKSGWLLLLFIVIAGLIEPIVPNIGKILYTLLLAVFGFSYIPEIKAWIQTHTHEKVYLTILSLFVIYCSLLIIIWHFLPNPYHLTPRYSNVEEILFNYLLLPVFCILAGLYITQKTFEQTMLLFSTCTVLGGLFMLYAHFGVVQLFQSPIVYIENVLQCRFTGCDSQIGWVDVFLKNYSFFPALGAWVAIPFAHKFRGWRKVGIIVLIVLNTCFLCFTINRGTIIGFALSIVLLLFYALRTIPWKKKIGWIFVFIALCSLLTLLLPQHIKVRFAEMASEFNLFFTTGHDSGSVSIRLTIWKTLLGHANEFWLFGDGPIYATDKLWIYLSDAGYQHYIDNGYIYHSQYLTYFHHFGVIGLLFLPVALLYPIYAMIRYRQVSITLIGIIVLFFVALIDDRYLGNPKTAQLLFFIYFSFFQREKWRHVEA